MVKPESILLFLKSITWLVAIVCSIEVYKKTGFSISFIIIIFGFILLLLMPDLFTKDFEIEVFEKCKRKK